MATIHELLPRVAASIGAISKSRNNTQQGYRFRGIEDVMNAAHPALTEHGVSVIPNVIGCEREERTTARGGSMTVTMLTIRYDFVAGDGSMVSATVVGEGMDSGDKSSNKAMSAAFKYAVGQVFSIPFDVIDSEDANPEPAPRAAKPVDKPLPPPPTITSATNAELEEAIAALAEWEGILNEANDVDDINAKLPTIARDSQKYLPYTKKKVWAWLIPAMEKAFYTLDKVNMKFVQMPSLPTP